MSPSNTSPLSTGLRASAPTADLMPQLGPLAELPGTWVGSGFNLISLPDKEGGRPFRLKINATHETLTFTPIGGPIPNRGGVQDDILFVGLHYLQQVSDGPTSEGLHIEPGLWLNLPAIDPPNQPKSVARLGTIPHGNALLAQGEFQVVTGRPAIAAVDTTPFTLDQKTGARVDNADPQYLEPFRTQPSMYGIPAGAVANPNVVLLDAIADQKIVSTTVLSVSANPVGGINGTPISPPSKPAEVGGIVNIPFVVANANANSFSAIFWIETVENDDGTKFMQLQYTQTVILEFLDLKWPHVSVATLIKQ